MKVENPAAFRFIMQDDLYLLKGDNPLPVTHDKPLPGTEKATPAKESQPITETPKIEFNYLGKNQKNILVLVHYTAHNFMDEVHLAALESTFKRKELTFDDVAILNLANYAEAIFEQLHNYFAPQKVLVLGENALAKGLPDLPFNTPHTTGNITALYTFGFDEMMTSKENKKAFWEKVKNF